MFQKIREYGENPKTKQRRNIILAGKPSKKEIKLKGIFFFSFFLLLIASLFMAEIFWIQSLHTSNKDSMRVPSQQRNSTLKEPNPYQEFKGVIKYRKSPSLKKR